VSALFSRAFVKPAIIASALAGLHSGANADDRYHDPRYVIVRLTTSSDEPRSAELMRINNYGKPEKNCFNANANKRLQLFPVKKGTSFYLTSYRSKDCRSKKGAPQKFDAPNTKDRFLDLYI
jgi:hypothetical protein